jgi:beta-glucosidase
MFRTFVKTKKLKYTMRKYIFWIGISVFYFQFIVGCDHVTYEFPFQNPKLSFEERAADLVSRLTLDEKIAQMMNTTPAVERLGIPRYNWWNECLHGVARTDYTVTVFPQAIGMAAGWDTEAMRTMADYTATEGRAVYNTASSKGDFTSQKVSLYYKGLTYWTPNINIFRDPRWGRGQETYGEDPFLTAALGTSFVHGLQGDNSRYLKAAACAKHFAVHSGPEMNRHEFDVTVSNYDLWDTYLPAFNQLVTEANVAGVMCAYNAYEGQPCCGSDKFMVDVLRNKWKFTGYVTSDCGAIDDFYQHHKTHPDQPSSAADAVIHGTDVECGGEYRGLKTAVENGLITEAQLDVSLVRLFTIRMRLGLFDPKEKVPFSTIDSTSLALPAHKAHALKMAQQAIVLLRNENNLLPIHKETLKKIAVVGPNAYDPEVQLGNYNGFPSRIITPLDGIKEAVGNDVEVYYEAAIAHVENLPKSFDTTLQHVADADLIVFVGGISPRLEGEEMPITVDGFYGGDRTSIALPKIQTEFLKALKATGKPVVFVMATGSAIAIPWEAQNIPAILNAWYGGEYAGQAIADVIFGNYNPSGHLPVTFYAADSDLPDFEDYNMENRTYKYFTGKPLYPFGYGLSFTTFDYEWASKPKATYTTTGTINCTLKIKNTGALRGDEVAQVYIKYPESGKILPVKELRHFQRLTLDKEKSGKVKVSIPVSQLAKWSDKANGFAVPTGEYTIFAGSHAEHEAISATFEIQ